MRGAIGNALLLNIIITFVAIIIIFFSSILAYSKAYRVKNRIVEIVEKYESYSSDAELEIKNSLGGMGYQLGECSNVTDNTLVNNTGYRFCIEEIKLKNTLNSPKYYKVTTYVQFYFPVIGEFFSTKVTSETKILGADYSY